MQNILILVGLAAVAGLITALLLWLDKPRCKFYEVDSARLIRAMKGE